MFRLFRILALVPMACTVLAAPAPKGSWERIDPDDDCLFDIRDSRVTLQLPGGDHELDAPPSKRSNAPRLLRDVEGDFVVRVRIRASFRPSEKSSVEEEASRVAAGLVLISADKGYVRFEYGATRRKGKLSKGFTWRVEGKQFGVNGSFTGWNPSDWAPNEENIYLSIERAGIWIRYVLSSDGKKWACHQSFSSERLPNKFKVGLVAYSTSTDPFKVRFDQFKLIRGGEKSK